MTGSDDSQNLLILIPSNIHLSLTQHHLNICDMNAHFTTEPHIGKSNNTYDLYVHTGEITHLDL